MPRHPAQKITGLQPKVIASSAVTKERINGSEIATTYKGNKTILDALMQPEQAPTYVPGQLKKKKKRKKRKGLNSNQ